MKRDPREVSPISRPFREVKSTRSQSKSRGCENEGKGEKQPKHRREQNQIPWW